MRANKKKRLKLSLLVLAVFVVAGIALSVVKYLNNPGRTYAFSSIQFTFDGAVDSIAPNGNRFDIKEIYSDAVLGEALKNAGFEGRYTVEQIKNQLEIEGYYPKDIQDQLLGFDSLLDFNASRTLTLKEYHPTLYTVKLYNDFDKNISRADLLDLLKNIMASYYSYFSEAYSVSIGSTDIKYNLSDYDYLQQLTILSRLIDQSSLYAQELYEKTPSFLYNGYGFNDIAVRLDYLTENDIARLSANITMSSVTKDTFRLMTQYQYEIQSLNNELNHQTKCLENVDQLISSYQKNEILYISAADSLTKIDGNSSETYDSLIEERKAIADGITSINTKIKTYTLLLNDLLNNTGNLTTAETVDDQSGDETETIKVLDLTSEELDGLNLTSSESYLQKTASLDASINSLLEKREEIMEDFSKLVDAYNAQIINNATVEINGNRYYTPLLFSSQFILTMIKTAGPICSIGFIICLVMIIIDRKKQQKSL